MKVLHVIPSMDPITGGPCECIRNSLPELEKLGLQNEVLCLDDPASAFIARDPLTIHAVGPNKSPWQYSSKLSPWLEQNITRFDVVIVHGLWLYHSYTVKKIISDYKSRLLADQSKSARIPKVYLMPHGMLDPYFQKASGRKLKALRNLAYWKLIEKDVIKKADGVLFTCEAELQLARNSFQPYKPKKEINVGLGILAPPKATPDMYSTFLEKCPELKNRSYILFLSRIHEKKGVDILLKAYEGVIKAKLESPDPSPASGKTPGNLSDWPILVVAGPGLDTPYGAYIQQIVAGSEWLRDFVIFPGMLTGDTKWGAFYGCDAFVLPSHQENFGIAVVEALACNKPVLISNQVNIWKEIAASGGGIVASNTYSGIKGLLKSWLSLSEEEKKQMNKLAYSAYENNFAVTPAAQKLSHAIQGHY
ncbi:glycosyltransferase [Sabulibacter ruber]|uniref:glycosyltransferase n=1 Tax=Sabulibacter ruber TaxID=2811901 RepID=UPI001A96FF0D|nr:glycosyltransferase [Sabulibacter ruber]